MSKGNNEAKNEEEKICWWSWQVWLCDL